ncbi:unnamed protein product (macronuclear) [Paramecium tetraurelia]|uniref:Uncharacterized protein n=1 Tax=Paramecium tetraurelia TaxID=5888 RepID=A0DPY2_PARTE|nr:uncharacterized protein GSPATT00002498001 [Paramecium tetraurelia]CAK85099.1 unnamed protein product [Paramecium tetraurelia]|eukprot:XP_001452496.1 hypothetical protein (macronuclear) [Paramecium tetraurelia strain d4-2]
MNNGLEDDDQEILLLQLQQKGRQLEQENFKLRKELANIRGALKFDCILLFYQQVIRMEVIKKVPDNNQDKIQIKYVLTHSNQIAKREAQVIFQEQPKQFILYGSGYNSDSQHVNEFQIFSYNVQLNDELQENPNIIATDQKIEIIFEKRNQKNKQFIQLNK